MTETLTRQQYLEQNARLGARAKGHKYGAKAKEVDGIKFPSTAEARRYSELLLRKRAGEIADLILQPRFALMSPSIGGDGLERVGDYVADFQYVEIKGDAYKGGSMCNVVEDVKGVATAVYKLKLKLFKAQYPHLVFREIKAPSRRRRRKAKARGKI